MRRTVLTLSLALLACSNGSPAPTPSATPPPADAATTPPAPEPWLGLAPGRHTAVPFVPSLPAELGDVQTRFAAAAASHQAWLLQYVAELQLPPGTDLPYHPNFGIGEDEYRKLVHAYHHPIFVDGPRQDLDVRVEHGALRFAGTGPLAALDRLTIEPSGRLLHGDDVVVEHPERIENHEASFGTWSGFSWRYEVSDLAARKLDALDVALGRVAGRRFIHLSRRRSDGQAMTESTELLAWID